MARAMKNSGIEWIGEIPAAWNMAKVSRFFDIQLGKMLQPDASEVTDTLEYYLCAVNLGGNKLKIDVLKQMWFSESDKAKFNVCKGDLLVVEGGDVASCDVITEDISDLYIQNALHRVRSNIGFDVRLLRYFLIFAKSCGYIDLLCNKATIAHFTKDKFSSIPYPAIPIEEQNSIADYLDTECARIDTVIEQTRASIEEYKKLKQAVITQAVTKGIRPGRKMKDSGIEWIGEIAVDFDLQKLKYITDILDQYRSPITADQRNQDADVLYDYYGASGVIDKIDGYTIDDHVMLIGEDGANLRMRNLPLMYEINGKAWINNHAHILKPKKTIHFYYLFYALESIDINPYITGSAQPKLSQDNLKNIWLPVPCYEEQIEIADYLRIKIPEIDAIILKNNDFVEELELYKRSLIFEYVTGKKEVL